MGLTEFEKFVADMKRIATQNNGVVTSGDMMRIGYDRQTVQKYFDLLPENEWNSGKKLRRETQVKYP